MAIFKNNLNRKFTQIPNAIIEDMRLKPNEFRLYCYVCSRPGTWEINNQDIMNKLGIKTPHTLSRYWKKLTKLKLIKREETRCKSGKFSSYDYTLLPYVDEPHAVETTTVQNHSGSMHIHSNTDKINNTELLSNTESNTSKSENDFSREDEKPMVIETSKEKELQKVAPKSFLNDFSEEVILTARECLKFFPSHLHPNTDKAKIRTLETVDKLIRLDGIPPNEIVRLTKEARADEFWSSNFLSINKLRSKDKNGVKYIVIFHEKFKAKEKMYYRQTEGTINNNAQNW